MNMVDMVQIDANSANSTFTLSFANSLARFCVMVFDRQQNVPTRVQANGSLLGDPIECHVLVKANQSTQTLYISYTYLCIHMNYYDLVYIYILHEIYF